MNTELERRYRRLLRLLPAGYRQAWEEDMVSAFLHSTEGRRIDRPPLGERVSVIALAVRLRLAGQHASPRGRAWHDAMLGLALLILLYQALLATVMFAQLYGRFRWLPIQGQFDDPGEWLSVPYWLLWIVTYISLALGWVAAARITAVLSVALIAGWIVSSGFLPVGLLAIVWPMLCALLLFAVPSGRRPRRALWLGVYLVASLVLAPAAALSYARRDWSWLWVVTGPLLWRLALLVGMIVVLTVPTVRRSPGWPLAFAIVDALFTIASILSPYVAFYGLMVGIPLVTPAADLVLIGLGVACAVVGVRGLRRLPRTVPGTA